MTTLQKGYHVPNLVIGVYITSTETTLITFPSSRVVPLVISSVDMNTLDIKTYCDFLPSYEVIKEFKDDVISLFHMETKETEEMAREIARTFLVITLNLELHLTAIRYANCHNTDQLLPLCSSDDNQRLLTSIACYKDSKSRSLFANVRRTNMACLDAMKGEFTPEIEIFPFVSENVNCDLMYALSTNCLASKYLSMFREFCDYTYFLQGLVASFFILVGVLKPISCDQVLMKHIKPVDTILQEFTALFGLGNRLRPINGNLDVSKCIEHLSFLTNDMKNGGGEVGLYANKMIADVKTIRI